MKKYLLFFLALAFMDFLAFAQDVYISELSYNPCSTQGDDSDCEYIILTNDDATAINISGWELNTGTTFTFPNTTIIPANGSLSVGSSSVCGAFSFDIVDGSMVLGNSGENIMLSDGVQLVSTVTYTDNIADGNCFAVCYDDQGTASECYSSLEDCFITITSVTPSCSGDNAQFVVLFNSNGSGTYEVDINGEGFESLASGGAYTIIGPTSELTGATVTVRDVNETSCSTTTMVDIPVCPAPPQNDNCTTGLSPIAAFNFDDKTSWTNNISTFYFTDPSGSAGGELSVGMARNDDQNTSFVGNTLFGRDFTPEASDNNVPANLDPYAFTFSNVDVSDYENIEVKFDYYVFANAEIGNYKLVVDGISQSAVEYFNDPEDGQSGTITINVPDGTSTVGLILEGNLNGTSDIIEFDNFSICGSLSALPITLETFTAKLENKNAILNWRTLSESNNDYFTIQKSFDGIEWHSIGEVNGQGDSDQVVGYEFIDNNVFNGVSYYRLKQVDFDGQFTYSEIVSITTDTLENIRLAAVNKQSFSLLSSIEGKASYKVYNSMGTIVAQGDFEALKGSQTIYYKNGELASGFYVVHFSIEGYTVTQKVIVH